MLRPGAWRRLPECWAQSLQYGGADLLPLAAQEFGRGGPGRWESASWRGPAWLLPTLLRGSQTRSRRQTSRTLGSGWRAGAEARSPLTEQPAGWQERVLFLPLPRGLPLTPVVRASHGDICDGSILAAPRDPASHHGAEGGGWSWNLEGIAIVGNQGYQPRSHPSAPQDGKSSLGLVRAHWV